MENLDRLLDRVAIVHPTNLEVAKYSQQVMTDEVQKVEVDEVNRPTLPSHCRADRIVRAILLHIADVTEYRQTIVMEIARTTIVVTEIAGDVATIDAIDQDEDKTLRPMTIRTMAMAATITLGIGPHSSCLYIG